MKFFTILALLVLNIGLFNAILSGIKNNVFENLLSSLISSIKDKLAKGTADIESLYSEFSTFSKLFPSLIPSIKLDPLSLDVERTEVEIIIHRGYNFEEHKILTKDNYILTAWRISKNITKYYPLMLQHGLLDSSFSFILNLPNESLAYIMADEGYDVWVTNNRGNRYSKEHKDWIPSDDIRFWDFTWDQFAEFDLPANVEYIKSNTKKEKIIYIGHSQGTTQFFAQMTMNNTFQNNFKIFFGLGPVIYANHQESFMINLVKNTHLADFLYSLNIKNFLYINSDYVPILGYLCGRISGTCINVVSLICGNTEIVHSNSSRMSVMASHEPGGTSMKNIVHWMQILRSGKFQKFDYGKEKNLEKYQSEEAPLYDVDKLKFFDIPKYLYIGDKDYLANTNDYERLIELLPTNSTFSNIITDYAHLDYLWGVDANKKIYENILQVLKDHDI